MKRATYEDVLNAPEHKVAEILDGELFLSPRPEPRHAVAASRLRRILEAFFTLAPDWVCDVLSPSTERIDRSRKLRVYAEAGVRQAWLVKPTDRTLEVLRLREGVWSIAAVWEDAAVVRVEPFEAIELQLRRL